jgi:hypothetical protein
MTKKEAKLIRHTVDQARLFLHLLNCVPHDDELTPEEKQEFLALKPFATDYVIFANGLLPKLKAYARSKKRK